jgi:hypothetical protein
MSTQYKIIREDDTKTFEDEEQFNQTVDLLESNDVDFETEEPEDREMQVADGGVEAEIVDHTEDNEESEESEEPDTVDAEQVEKPTPAQDAPDAMDVARNSLADPLETLPGWMKTEVSYSDRGDSSITINKRGTEVIANYLDLEPDFEVITSAEDTDFEYAYHKCTVEKPDGRTFEGYGTARADGNDQAEDDGWKLEMMAQTRAYKRAVKFATGDGIQAFVEAQQ